MSTEIIKEETLFQKEKRLKSRKQSYKVSYKKGVYYNSWQLENIIGYLKQEDILVKVHAAGDLSDGTQFLQITIEGLVALDTGI